MFKYNIKMCRYLALKEVLSSGRGLCNALCKNGRKSLHCLKYNIKMYRYLALKEVLSNGRNTNFIDIAQ